MPNVLTSHLINARIIMQFMYTTKKIHRQFNVYLIDKYNHKISSTEFK